MTGGMTYAIADGGRRSASNVAALSGGDRDPGHRTKLPVTHREGGCRSLTAVRASTATPISSQLVRKDLS
jgi:hypothetical protein